MIRIHHPNPTEHSLRAGFKCMMFIIVSFFASLSVASATPVAQVTNVAAPTDATYGPGDVLTFTVSTNTAVTVTGTPQLTLTLGSATVYASYTATGSTDTALKFSYTIQSGDVALDGISVASPVSLNGGSIVDANNSVAATLTFTPPTTTAVVVDALPAEVTAHDSTELALYLRSTRVSTINLVAATTYTYAGGTIARTLTIRGNGATLQAGAGVTDDVIRSGTADGITGSLPDYTGKTVFLRVTGSLSLDHLTLQNNGTNSANVGFFTIINVKNGGTLSADYVTFEDFHNNPTPGTNLAFGIHTEPSAVSLTLTHCTFADTNALRNHVAARGGALTITDNSFTGSRYPERLRNSDGYEYALYLYGGHGTVTGNTITGFDATTQLGYSSAAVSIIGFYNIDLTVTGNVLSANSIGIDVTRTWTGYSTPVPTVKVNGLTLETSADAYAIGEQLRSSNNENIVSVSLDQGDEVEFTPVSGPTYFGVMGGYRSPYLTASAITPTSATITLPSSERDVLAAANAIALEMQTDSETTWSDASAVTTWSGTPASSAALALAKNHTYRFRTKLTHTSAVDGGDPIARTLITYSAPVTVDTTLAPTIASVTAPSDSSYQAGDVLTFTVNTSSAVTVTGSPRLALTIGSATVYATYTPTGSTDTALKFTYTVQSGDVALDGISVASPVSLNGGSIVDSANSLAATLTFTPPTTTAVVVDALPAEVTAHDSTELALYLRSTRVSTINLVAATTYTYAGGTIARTLTIDGHGATLQAGAGITTDVIRTGTADGVTLSGLSDYSNVKVFLAVSGSLTLKNLTLQNNGTNSANVGFFTIVNVKNGGSFVADGIEVKDFHNNPTPGTNLAFGFHSEPTAVKLTVTNSTFGSSNALRNVIAARGGALTITDNTFTGTAFPERLRNSDGYEYALYLYGGHGTVTGNTITGFDASTQLGYSSAALAIIGFYPIDLTVTGNVLSANSIGIDVTRTWTSFSNPIPTVKVNGLTLETSADAYAIGEQLRSANNENIVSVSLDQNDEVEFTPVSGPTYTGVMGGYRSPYLTASAITPTSATITLPSGERDVLAAANAIALEMQTDSETTWSDASAVTTWSGSPSSSAALALAKNHTYRFRTKLTHTSAVDGGDPTPRTLITYSAPVTVDTTFAPTIASVTAPSDSSYQAGDVLTFTVNTSSAVTVTGSPRLALTIGSATVYATYTATGSTATALKFTYTVQPVDIALGGLTLASPVSLNGGSIVDTANSLAATLTFTPPATTGIVVYTPYHSADTNRDWAISLSELTRVIELYNTRSGSTRTGDYRTATTSTEDGYESGSGSIVGDYHRADSDHDGKISLSELTRVIELYNTRTGTTRTGTYHQQNGTEDGYAPGSSQVP